MMQEGDSIFTLEYFARIIKLCDSDDYIAVPSGLTYEELVLWLSTDHEKE